MAAAFVRYWIELHVGQEEGEVISDDLLGVTEVMYVSSPFVGFRADISASDQNEDPWADYYKLV
jgi:hypothetical protein